ncbi:MULTISPECIES: Mrp/NBP35 family ATP-binding protein [Candidatus Ichthyocystis]|uniref:Iron-sulfur cluster carrier protein n=1 Tax=Candidatus Ichthyocystis hellenicum TaxID=1561003 RepID=A0A0S4M099_9BURK|nr:MULTISPECIES: Mrp/NBP35 family ATP-binding protein [Ichthyocystis]CUT17237.1 putative ATP-binding protein involved in chromosome partitioning [Candidatus Ichthyocystis hellenicum]
MGVSSSAIYSVLSEIYDPYQELSLVAAGQITVSGKSIRVSIPYPSQCYHVILREQIQNLLDKHFPGEAFNMDISGGFSVHENARGMASIPGVKNTLVIASGKGGVGKSTVALAIAKAYVKEGASVGILDADIYGPSLPQMVGCREEKPEINSDNKMIPIEAEGLTVMSIGYLVRPEAAVAWRGPMATQALTQLLMQTEWGSLDVLVIDMPPGTGDIYLTLSQKIPVTAAVVVTSPHSLAFDDARRSVHLFNRVDIPVLGIVENMSFFYCSACDHKHFLFGQGAGERLANDVGTSLLGQLPFSHTVDDGGDHYFKTECSELSRRVGARLSQLREQAEERVKIEIKPVVTGKGASDGN